MDEKTGLSAWILEYMVQVTVSTLGSIVAGIICGLIPAFLIAALTKNLSGGNFFDHVIDQPLFRVLSDNPYFLGPILCAFILGVFGNRPSKTRSALYVWVVPTIILIWNVFTWKSYTGRSTLADAWANYFGSDCGDSECLYELVVTAPFLTSVAYTLGWFSKSVLRASRRAEGTNV